MYIGRTPGQRDALDEIRAEYALLKRRALRWRTIVGGSIGLFLGLGFGFEVRNAIRPRPDHLAAQVAVEDSTPISKRSLYLASSAQDEELVANYSAFFAAQSRHPNSPELVLGVQRLANLVVDEVRVLPVSSRALVSWFVLAAMDEGLCATDVELLELAPALRRYLR